VVFSCGRNSRIWPPCLRALTKPLMGLQTCDIDATGTGKIDGNLWGRLDSEGERSTIPNASTPTTVRSLELRPPA